MVNHWPIFRRAWVGAVLLCLAVGFPAVGQRVLTVSATMTAAREAAGLYLHSLDYGAGGVLPGAYPIPGTHTLGPLLVSGDGRWAFLSTGTGSSRLDERPDASSACYLNVFRTAPLERVSTIAGDFTLPRREWAAAVFDDPLLDMAKLVVLGQTWSGSGEAQGWVETRSMPVTSRQSGVNAPGVLHMDLPGFPVGLKSLSGEGDYVILCRCGSEESGALLVWNAVEGACHPQSVGDMEGVPSALEISRSGRWLFVLTVGFSLQRQETPAASWVYVYDTARWTLVGSPLELPGIAVSDSESLHAVVNEGCWITTHTPGSDFAYATRVRVVQDPSTAGTLTVVKEAEYSFSGFTDQFHLSVHPESEMVAVAIENQLEIWPGGTRSRLRAAFATPLQALYWSEEGLLAGEAGCLHRVNPATGASESALCLQSGWVAQSVLLPSSHVPQPDADGDGVTDSEERRLGTLRTGADTDGDGLPDGIDPEPLVFSPNLVLPWTVQFHGEAIGREVRALRIWPQEGLTPAWRVIYDEKQMPWLLLHPRSGQGRRPLYFSIDPARYTPGQSAAGTIRIEMEGAQTGIAAKGSPAEVSIQILPARQGPHRILWVWGQSSDARLRDPGDPRRLRVLSELLASPPYYFAHQEVSGPFQEPLDPYTVVVLEASAAAQGALTRQAVLDYVSRGGSLLFLGSYLEGPSHPALINWLSPLGICIDTSLRVDGRYAAAGDKEVLRYWRDFKVERGCAISAQEGFTLEAPARTGAVFVAQQYGYGRIALLAAATPLESASVQAEESRRFAGELFRWLAQARHEINDLDGDGLPDATEDAKNPRVADPGETDFLNPDTDSDGIADGLEDVNRNGRVDDGETDPRNPDSDGDGIMDGADPSACPIIGTPHIAGVEPPEGPAEGGSITAVVGRNLTPESEFWFGDRKVPWSRIANNTLAFLRTPEYMHDEGGPVSVRVVNGDGKEGALPGGFRYTARSEVRVRLQWSSIVQKSNADCGGLITGLLEIPHGTALGRMILILQAVPAQGFSWGEVHGARGAGARSYAIQGRTLGDDILFIVVEGHSAYQSPEGVLFEASWRKRQCAVNPQNVEVTALQALASTPYEGRLQATVEPVTLELQKAAPGPR